MNSIHTRIFEQSKPLKPLLRDESISDKIIHKCKHYYHKSQGTVAYMGRAGLPGAGDALVLDVGGGYADVCFIILLNYPNMFYAVCMV